MAAAILVTVAVAAHGSMSAQTPAPFRPAPLTGWAVQSVPVITALIDDVTAVERDTTPASARALGRDLARARALPAPPDAATSSVWRTTLARLQAASRTLGRLGPTPSQADVAGVRSQVGTAGTGLIEIGQALTAGG